VCRWISDSLRVNDDRVAGMTGAQWMSLAMVPAGIWILWKVRPRLAALVAAEAEAEAEGGSESDTDAADDDTADAAADDTADEGDGGADGDDGEGGDGSADEGATVPHAEG
jgi:hypothetical protein